MKIYLKEENGCWELYEAADLSKQLASRNISIGYYARIGDCATIGDHATIGADYNCLVLGSIGSRRAPLTLYYHKGELWAGTGCFLGPAKDFISKVKSIHNENEHEKAYTEAIKFGRKILRKPSAAVKTEGGK